MITILSLIKRNSLLYLRNKSTVFFSLISMLIIIMLYSLFMADVQIDSLAKEYGNKEAIEWMINSWIMGGIIAVNAVNVTMTILITMVEDKEKNIFKDFLSSPIKTSEIILGYLGAAILVGIVLSIISFIIAEIYIILNGGDLLPFISILKVLFGIIISVISIASFFLFVLIFVKSEKTASVISTIVGTLSGFLAGVYVPIGVMPEFVQTVMKLMPINYIATYFKSIFVEEPNKLIFKDIESLNAFNETMGNTITLNGTLVNHEMYFIIILGSALLFFVMSFIAIRKIKWR